MSIVFNVPWYATGFRGDQFEQADRRWVAGARVTHRQQVRWGTWRGENAVGAAVRHDDIPVVGLYRTESRQRAYATSSLLLDKSLT